MRILFLITIIISCIAIIFFLSETNFKNYKKGRVNIGNFQASVWLADSQTKRAKGLMGVKKLNEGWGMLFPFPTETKHTFWMVNTKIPLDIIWISSENEIVYIYKGAKPCTKPSDLQALCTIYKPDEKAKYVLELNAGETNKHDINVGDKVIIAY